MEGLRFSWHDYEECHLLGCCGVALVRTDVSEECIASIIRVTRIVSPKRRFLQEPLGVTSQKTTFFGKQIV
jgi:hypothetical protein